MRVIHEGKEGEVVKRDFYCKAGAYEHKNRDGWVLIVAGKVVLGSRKFPTNVCDGLSRYDWPEYKTRKALLEDIAYENKEYAEELALKVNSREAEK